MLPVFKAVRLPDRREVTGYHERGCYSAGWPGSAESAKLFILERGSSPKSKSGGATEIPLLPTSSAQLAARGLLRVLYETFKGTVILPSRPVSLSCTRNFIVYSPGASSMTLFRANPFSWAC